MNVLSQMWITGSALDRVSMVAAAVILVLGACSGVFLIIQAHRSGQQQTARHSRRTP